MYSGTVRNVGSFSRRKVDGKREPVILTFTASATWTIPAGVTKVDVFLVGGGGNGANGATNGTGYGGGGGGGGNVQCVSDVAVTPGANVSVVVGSANAASSFESVNVLGGENAVIGNPASSIPSKGGSGNSGGGMGSSSNGEPGGVQASRTNHATYSGKRHLYSSGMSSAISITDFNGIFYGNGGGAGAGSQSSVGGSAGTGAGAGGAGSSSPTDGGGGTSNSGGGGGGGGCSTSTAKAGGSGGSGLVQIRYWKE